MIELFTSETGIKWSFEIDGDKWLLKAEQDVWDMLELNKSMFNANEGWSWSRCMRRAASVPHILRLKWLWEEGWDAWNPDHQEQLDKKLNDPDYRYLRTAPGRLACSDKSAG